MLLTSLVRFFTATGKPAGTARVR